MPTYTITPKILKLVSQIQSLLGEFKHLDVKKPSIKLRKENKIKTIHHSLAIEGNSLTESQISLLSARPKQTDRIEIAAEHFGHLNFTRKAYMLLHKDLSTSTASRDLEKAVSKGILKVEGIKSTTKYIFKKSTPK